MSSTELGLVLDLGCSSWLEKFNFRTLSSLVAPKEGEPPPACWSSLCMSSTTGMEDEGWLGCVSLAELEWVSVLEWPVSDMGASGVETYIFDPLFVLAVYQNSARYSANCVGALVNASLRQQLDMKSETCLKYSEFVCRKGFGLSGFSKKIGSSLGILFGEDGFWDDDSDILVGVLMLIYFDDGVEPDTLNSIKGLGEDISKLILSGNEITGLFEIAIALVLLLKIGTFS
ncbi:hypothetical protein Tco_0303651 [Tanacetum coccineum]